MAVFWKITATCTNKINIMFWNVLLSSRPSYSGAERSAELKPLCGAKLVSR